MKILVTGANGLIGKKIAKRLVASAHHEIFATSHKKFLIPGTQMFTSDLVNADLNHLVEHIRPDVVVHCAALTNPDACEVDRFRCKRMNVEMTQRVAAVCRDYKLYMLLLSTDLVFDGKRGDYSETDTPEPGSYYGRSKVEAEALLLKYGVKAAIIRSSQVYGYEKKLSRQNFMLNAYKTLAANKKFNVPVDRIRSFTWAEDLAIGIENIIENQITGLYHMAGCKPITFGDFALQVAKTFDLNSALLNMIPASKLIEAAPRPFNSSLNTQKAQKQLNYQSTPTADALNIIKKQMEQDKD